MGIEDNGWKADAKLVLAELKRHSKWLSEIDKKMDNHITYLEHRLTCIETTLKNTKYIMSMLFGLVIALIVMFVSNLMK